MAKSPLPTPEELRQLLRYDPETGNLYWLPRLADTQPKRTWNTRYAGKVAGTPRPDGYIHISIGGRFLFAHRVAWALHFGKWPLETIDHINGVRDANQICNLRDVSASMNNRNMAMNNKNSSGHVGVSWHKRDKRWVAYVQHESKHICLGSYRQKTDAINAAQAKRVELGFSSRHGSSGQLVCPSLDSQNFR